MKTWFILALLFCSTVLRAAEDRVLFLGDSITYDGRWAAWVESALRDPLYYPNAEIVNMGLGSETTSGLSEPNHAGGKFPRPCIHERLDRVLEKFKPTRVFACYGMNDGIYLPLDQGRLDAYAKGMTLLKEKVEATGALIVFITPPLFNPDKNVPDPSNYDAVLDAEAAWLLKNRAKEWKVIDIRPDLRAAVAKAKGENPAFIYAADGIHPGAEGHRFIADAIARRTKAFDDVDPPHFTNDAAYDILYRRAKLLRDAWLTETKHTRPGVPEGLPLAEANELAAKLLADYRIADSAKVSDWNGYERLDFTVDGRPALLVRPKVAAKGKPWIWRTEFFGHEPQGDLALLEKGWHVAYIDVHDMFGAPVALDHMDAFYDHLTSAYGLFKKTTLEGFSRGGLYAFNWAARHPDRTASLSVDAPVCDIKSWPLGRGAVPRVGGEFEKCLAAYHMTEAEAIAYTKNPVDNLAPLASAGIPILAIIGDADEAVPVKENTDLVEQRYKELGGTIQVIRKPGGKHHPHSLPDPKPIVDFVTGEKG
jgi:pimeloyl-ACP methyl ester carboxylesterase/lysophospholipase L1-like esterase